MTPIYGATKKPSALQEEKLVSTDKKPRCQPTGAHPFPKSASGWRLTRGESLSRSTNKQILCIHWSLTASTAPPHWVVTCGRTSLALTPLYSRIATGKGLTVGQIQAEAPKQGSVSLAIMRMSALPVTPGSDLVLGGTPMIPIRVETRLHMEEIMATIISRLWGTSWCSSWWNV